LKTSQRLEAMFTKTSSLRDTSKDKTALLAEFEFRVVSSRARKEQHNCKQKVEHSFYA
jgi:hypothetical protein